MLENRAVQRRAVGNTDQRARQTLDRGGAPFRVFAAGAHRYQLQAGGNDAAERVTPVGIVQRMQVDGLRETVGLCRQAGSVPLPDDVRQRARARVRQLLDRDPDDTDTA